LTTWQKHGAAWVAALRLVDGRSGKAVVVAGRDNPKGAMIVLPPAGSAGGTVPSIPLTDAYDLLTPLQIIDVLCLQERAFGTNELEPPEPM